MNKGINIYILTCWYIQSTHSIGINATSRGETKPFSLLCWCIAQRAWSVKASRIKLISRTTQNNGCSVQYQHCLITWQSLSYYNNEIEWIYINSLIQLYSLLHNGYILSESFQTRIKSMFERPKIAKFNPHSQRINDLWVKMLKYFKFLDFWHIFWTSGTFLGLGLITE